MQDYILKYKDENENNTDDVTYFFKELLIDIPQDLSTDADTTNKLFITKLSLFQNIKSTNTINILTDHTFKYQISSANTTILFLNPTSYSFTISTDMQYNNFEFKGLLIDSGTAIWSISDLGQLKAL